MHVYRILEILAKINNLIMIFLLQGDYKYRPRDGRHEFCENNGRPYPVHSEQQRQQKHSPEFKHECP